MDKQGRKIQLTINNPEKHGLSRELIVKTLNLLKSDYFCLGYEKNEKNTHVHIFIYRSKSAYRFSTIKKKFPSAHIEIAKGSVQENIDYIKKEGKWTESKKAETSILGSFYETGEKPVEKEKQIDKKERLVDLIEQGYSTRDIIKLYSEYAYQVKRIDELREIFLEEKFCKSTREISVKYLFGKTGLGKSRYIFENHGYENVCRITSYRKNDGVYFDTYKSEDVLVFEEFDSQIPLTEMLNYLDIYPLKLKARYFERTACYTKVYITSNKSIEEQYTSEQYYNPQTWEAFLRRIDAVIEFTEDGEKIIKDGDWTFLDIKEDF